ncbi:MAG: prepilin-type N-terminal cleavage/methylation domain-containing protein [Marinisporobacter sp.]|jgi:competence protein ComGD|nr:prepilin-type N-terminal cleavage/methylation domain-containing protein [Marinisporobacter sp.]
MKKRIELTHHTDGFTLIEILLVLSLISILSLMVISINKTVYNTVLLETTTQRIKSALTLAQQLSISETNSYKFEFINTTHIIRVKENEINGKTVLKEKINRSISIRPSTFGEVIYDCEGNTGYHKFSLVNKNKKTITIQTMIGTGRIQLSKKY